MKAKYKSQINLEDLILYVVLYSILVVYPLCTIVEIVFVKYLAICSLPIFSYIIWCVFINIYFFYDDKIKIVYIFRFINREKDVLYTDIDEVRYVHTEGTKQPMVVFVYKGKSFSKLFLPSNSFIHRYFEKRKEILFFLHSKGIPIIVDSVFNKDKRAFDNIPNIYIQK
jgi:hypothetical protein